MTLSIRKLFDLFTSSSKIPPVDPTLGLLHHGEHLHSDGQDYISKHHLDIMHISLGNWCKDFFFDAPWTFRVGSHLKGQVPFTLL